MHEQEKLSEAEYFYARMKAEANNPNAFNYNLSAFLSAARSVLQYALEEARTKSGGQSWYDSQISRSAMVKFFKDRRDINIHQTPLTKTLSQVVTVRVQEVLRISDAVSITKVDEQGNMIQEHYPPIQESASDNAEDRVEIEYRYSFPEWPATNDAFDLCERYLSELKAIVKAGIANKILTP